MVDNSTSQNRGHRHSLGCSLHRPQNRPEPANTGWRGRATVRPDRLSPKLRVNGGRGAPRAMRAPDGDPTAAAAVSSSPGDTVSAPCRGSRPGPAALDRPPQSRGPAPARPGRYGRLDESSTGGSGGRPPWGRGRQAARAAPAARQAACSRHDRVPWVSEISSQAHRMAYFASRNRALQPADTPQWSGRRLRMHVPRQRTPYSGQPTAPGPPS